MKQREALLELVFERGLTARDLAQEIAKRNRKAKAEATPGHLLPRGTKNSLDFLGSMAQKVREFCEKRFASAIYDPLMNTEGEGLDQRTITKVTDVRQRVEELVNNLLESVCPGLSDIEGHLNSLGLPPGPKQPRGLSDRDKSSPFGRWRELP